MRKICLILLIFNVLFLNAQQENLILKKELPQKASAVFCDNLGNIYTLNNALLTKYNSQGEMLYSYSDFKMGKITSIDVANPMKILVFSKDFMKITFLNNRLAEQNQPYDLFELKLSQVESACISYDNGFWVYDAMLDKLLRYDANANLQIESRQVVTISGQKINPYQIQELNKTYLIAGDTEYGIFVFDRFGTFIKRFPVTGIDKFSSLGTILYYVNDNKVCLLDVESSETKQYDLPDSDVIHVVVEEKQIITLNRFGIVKIYTYS